MKKIQNKWVFNQCLSIGKRFVLIYTNVSFSIFSAKKLISLRFDNLNSWMYKFDKSYKTFASDLYLIQTLAFGWSLHLLENNQWRNFHILSSEDIDYRFLHWIYMYIIKRKLHGGLKIWILSSRDENIILLNRYAYS